ncbi:MAG TPA: hypothetical protein EYG18_10295 [Micavibrio sp.]|jgi:hypothetical protein|nr:hypothetical protein [Pseudomonadota bacterium]HIF25381.1 hypothetical protein [Micavibrio sp.]HIL29648.1 hypothetical protein [Micavibrio sp.]
MSNSKIAQLGATAQYPITDVFAAVSADLAEKKAVVESYTEDWQKGWAGSATVSLLEKARDQLVAWIESGATHVQPEQPFADANTMCNPGTYNLANQFHGKKVQPLVAEEVPGYAAVYKHLQL